MAQLGLGHKLVVATLHEGEAHRGSWLRHMTIVQQRARKHAASFLQPDVNERFQLGLNNL